MHNLVHYRPGLLLALAGISLTATHAGWLAALFLAAVSVLCMVEFRAWLINGQGDLLDQRIATEHQWMLEPATAVAQTSLPMAESQLTPMVKISKLLKSMGEQRALQAELAGAFERAELEAQGSPVAPEGEPPVEETTAAAQSPTVEVGAPQVDPLTGLLNRQGLAAAYDNHVHTVVGVVHVDLEGFQAINHHHGYEQGDLVLNEIARRLVEVLPRGCAAARIDGSEFLALFEAGSARTESIAKRVVARLSESIPLLNGGSASVRVRAGWATTVADPGRDLLRRATTALSEAKRTGEPVSAYNAETAYRIDARRRVEIELRDALARREFVLYAQPIADMLECRITGIEILLRWNHPTAGVIAPGDFLDVAESADLIDEIDRWAIKAACTQARTSDPRLRYSLNLSSRFIAKSANAAYVLDTLKRNGLPAARIQIELKDTDRSVDPTLVVAAAQYLAAHGASVALDEFGMGYSSLANLLQMPVSTIKLDRSMVRLGTKPEGRAVISAIAAFARHRNIDLIASGVETGDEAHALQSLGCRYLQGHLVHRPQPLAELLENLPEVVRAMDKDLMPLVTA